jgi:type III pantothenate kinase
MDINLLVLSVGNSRTALGVFEAGELKHSTRLSNADRESWQKEIAKAWRMLPEVGQPAIAGASVNPAMNDSFEDLILRVTNHTVQWVGEEIDFPIKVLTDEPSATGVDRVLNIAAAYEQMQKACVVVDAGTAITVDVCDDAGAFLGGAIAPGVGLMLDALHEKTAQLPRLPFEQPDGAIGKNTQQAILSGVYHGVRGMVKELVEAYAVELGHWPDLIATGGDAKALFEGWELVHAVSPDLTLYGVALAYTNQNLDEEK